ncbi:pentapeptide repeat-containing protein (plasmid) [Dermatophilaceae bacterium Sec6.4]
MELIRRKWPQIVACLITAVVVVTFVVWALPLWLTLHPHLDGYERHEATNAARTGVAAVLVAIGATIGLLYTAQTYRLAGKGQIADRYTKAVEQLANENVSVKIGGIHGLGRTVRDAEDYRPVVASILAAYIRDRSIKSQEGDGPCVQCAPHTQKSDVTEALAVLLLLAKEHPTIRALDLHGTCLAGSDMMRKDLVDVQLNDACLVGTKLSGTDLRGADFENAVLKNAVLHEARINKGTLSEDQKDSLAKGTITWE